MPVNAFETATRRSPLDLLPLPGNREPRDSAAGPPFEQLLQPAVRPAPPAPLKSPVPQAAPAPDSSKPPTADNSCCEAPDSSPADATGAERRESPAGLPIEAAPEEDATDEEVEASESDANVAVAVAPVILPNSLAPVLPVEVDSNESQEPAPTATSPAAGDSPPSDADAVVLTPVDPPVAYAFTLDASAAVAVQQVSIGASDDVPAEEPVPEGQVAATDAKAIASELPTGFVSPAGGSTKPSRNAAVKGTSQVAVSGASEPIELAPAATDDIAEAEKQVDPLAKSDGEKPVAESSAQEQSAESDNRNEASDQRAEFAPIEANAAEFTGTSDILPVADSKDTSAQRPVDAPPAAVTTPPADLAVRTQVSPQFSAQTLATSSASGANSADRGGVQIDTARFLHRVARAFESAQERGGEVRLRLSPPELGALRLDVRLQDGALVAHLETETAAARTALIENLPALRERLAEQGVRIERFDVDLMQRPAGGSPDQPQQRQPLEPLPTGRLSRPASAPAAETPHASARTISHTSADRLNVII